MLKKVLKKCKGLLSTAFSRDKVTISPKRVKYFLHKHPVVGVTKMQIPPTISIIVPCYNHDAFLSMAIQSIINQTCFPDEVLFVDDHSNDNTKTIITNFIAEYQGKLKIIFIENKKNIGQCACINKAVERAESSLIMILNDDDYLFHDIVFMMKELFTKNKVALIGAHSIHFNDDRFLEHENKFIENYSPFYKLVLTIQTPTDAIKYILPNELNMTHSGSTFLKGAWKQVNGYWPKSKRIILFSDRDFQLRINLLYPVGVSYNVPFSFWRTNSSVDAGLFS